METDRQPYHIHLMASRDKFVINLHCPSCGKDGIAQANEADGIVYLKGDRATSISDLPDGFKIVQQPSKMGSVDIFCQKCDISAIK
jgi:hypothetical protein